LTIISSSRLYQVFKYAVYAFLTLNIFLFYGEESAAAPLQFPGGINLGNVREAFSATIDTFAWVVLLLMFELETYVLEDRHFTPKITVTLRVLRGVGYALILMAFAGYIDDMLSVSDTIPLPGVTDLCQLPAGEWSWAVTFGEYVDITAANCAALSDAGSFLQYRDLPIVVDAAGNIEVVRLAWADVINAAAWILVVVILEVDVWLQEHQRYEGAALYGSNAFKFVLYSTLLLVAIYWSFKGDLLDVWDAYMWLIAFVFIEMNVFEWRAEEKAAAHP
jgi:hypothetical protein